MILKKLIVEKDQFYWQQIEELNSRDLGFFIFIEPDMRIQVFCDNDGDGELENILESINISADQPTDWLFHEQFNRLRDDYIIRIRRDESLGDILTQ